MECAVLFADVAGSTALYEVLGDERAFELIEACLSTMGACSTEHHGRVIKTIGDAVLAVFPTSDDAAAAAIAMQTRVDALDSGGSSTRPGLRIGFHFGPVVAHAQDVFGDSVNLASRLCDLASRGQIVTDRETAQRLSQTHRAALQTLYAVPVKGKAQEVELVELGWQAAGDEKTLIVAPQPGASAALPTLLALDLGERHIEMGPACRKVTIGREPEADFSIPERSVSRAHARIERRRERFVLADHSANGCFVSFEGGGSEIRVHHEELTLLGHGWIAFGQPRAQARQVAEFRCLDGAPG